MKKLFFLFLFAWIALGMNAQKVVREAPPSYAYEQVAKAKLQSTQKLVIPFKVDALLAEDNKLEGLGFPVRVAKTIQVELTPENSGEWTQLPNGQNIWRLEIEASDAMSISLLYDKFIIPRNGKLFIYDVDYKVIQVYTDLDNPKRQEYSTDFIPGDKLRLEYVAPVASAAPQIVISGVSYAYKDVIASLEAKIKDAYDLIEPRTPSNGGASDACEVNVNCSEGENWYHQKRGVAATLQVLSDGAYICSGALVNNALKDRTPYFLMAYHCGGEATAAQFNQWKFYFHWERTGCENTSPLAEYKTITGATYKVGTPLDGASDGLLLELNEEIPRDWDVFFNGWDRRNVATAGGVGIHHPAGDVKKISTYTQVPVSATANMSSGERGATNAHWSFIWAETEHGYGVTEGGSSGSPLFNSEGRIIGTLTGGSSSCANPTGNNIYGKVSWHWDQSPDVDSRMAKYLDPNNSGVEFIDGTYGEENLVTFSASATDIWASEKITFTNRSFGDIDTWFWDFTGSTSHTLYIGKNPPAVLYNTAGNYAAKLTALKSGNVVGEFVVPIKVTLKQNYCPNSVTVGTATTTSAFPLGMSPDGNNRHSLSSAIYTAAELGLTGGNPITSLEWDAMTAVATNRTLYIYLKEVTESEFAAGSTWADEIAGATLVYQASVMNIAGANKITLATPFTYSGTKNLKVLVRASTTTSTNANSACTYTETATNTHQQWAVSTGANPSTAAGTPNVNRPNITLYYGEPCGSDVPVADFSLSSTSIYEGETITFTDLSTGPVVTWKWTFDGGTPATSNQPSPTVRYMTKGVYNVKLETINDKGADTKAVTITVNDRTPVADFAAFSNGLIRQADFGPFLPLTGGSVEFENKTLYYPKSLTWRFHGVGVDPASSVEENPEVNYPAGAGKYDVSLYATNDAGTGIKTKQDYVQVGGTAEVWNVMLGENPLFRYASSGWALTGADLFTKTSERLEAPAGGEISKIRIYTSNVAQNSNSYMTVQLFSDNNGVPGTAISPEKSIQGGSGRIAANGYNTFTFDEPIPASGAFHVVVGSTNYNSTYFTVPCVENRASGYSTVCAFYNNAWRDLASLVGLATSMNIIPEFTYTTAELTSPAAFNKKDIDGDEETITFNTSGHSWTATADEWIQLGAKSGSLSGGAGAVTFTVADNLKLDVRKGIIKLNVAGNTFDVYVVQAGAAPMDITAGYNEDNTGIEVAWVHDKHLEHLLPPTEDIFEDVEEFASFAKAPTDGKYPWSYIDGDGSATYGITSVDFPGSGEAMSFIVFDGTGLSATYAAHSGAKYFATFAAVSPPNNDWIISPELNFNENFTLSFWARSLISDYGLERFRVVYSTGGKTQADFTQVITSGSYVEAPITWTKYTYTIPKAAKYVAINCVSNDAFAFFLDDIFIGTGTAPVSAPANVDLLAQNVENSYVKMKRGAGQSIADSDLKPLSEDWIALGYKDKTREKIAIAPEDVVKRNQLEASASEDEDEDEDEDLETLQWYNGHAAYIYGNPDGGKMEAAIRFTPSDLFFYNKATIKAVEIFTYRPCTNVKLIIRQGNEIIHTQSIDDIEERLLEQTIRLSAPVLIDANKELYIGYEYEQFAGGPQDMYVAISDDGPAVSGKGNLYSLNGAPFAPTTIGNWAITAYIQPAPVNVTFNVYRDGNLIAEGLTEKKYVDTELPDDKACYSVKAIYGHPQLESSQSVDACVYPILFVAPTDLLTFAADGSTEQTVELTITDPEDYITEKGLEFQIIVPEWLSFTKEENEIVFTAEPNISGSLHTDFIQIQLETDDKLFPSSVYKIPVAQKSQLTLDMLDYDLTTVIYSSSEKSVSVALKSAFSGLGDVAVNYAGTTGGPVAAGVYPVSMSALEGSDFEAVDSLGLGELTVAKAPLTIRPNDETRMQGTENPEFTLTITGLQGDDSEADLLNVTILTTATISSIADLYPIIAYAESPNYNISFQAGVLTVSQGSGLSSVVISDQMVVYPNPASKSSSVYVIADLDETTLVDAVIAIYNASGSLVKSVPATGKQTEVQLPAASGTYFFTLKGLKEGVIVKSLKVIVK